MTVNKCSLHVRVCFLIAYDSATVLREPRDGPKRKASAGLTDKRALNERLIAHSKHIKTVWAPSVLISETQRTYSCKEPNTAMGSGMGIKYSPHNDLSRLFAISLHWVLVYPRELGLALTSQVNRHPMHQETETVGLSFHDLLEERACFTLFFGL